MSRRYSSWGGPLFDVEPLDDMNPFPVWEGNDGEIVRGCETQEDADAVAARLNALDDGDRPPTFLPAF